MPGFIIHTGESPFSLAPEKRTKLVVDRISGKDFLAERRVVNKFMNDRVFYDDTNYTIIVEGVVLNNRELVEKYKTTCWRDCIIKMYLLEGESFFRSFRGSFSGAFFNKRTSTWIIYTGHTGEKQVFYSKVPGGYLFGSEMRFMVDNLKHNQIPVTPNNTGIYLALTQGFCIESHTLVNEVHKLIAGNYIRLNESGMKIIQYHRFSNKPDLSIDKITAINRIDELFRQSIIRQFEKDKEYGYKHLTCLSGGLDSRMTVWVAHHLGYSDQLNITFSQSGSLDFSIAQRIATDLHHDWLFKPLDGGDCIKSIDDVTRITYGSANFFGLANGKTMEDLINYDPFGIIHTGQIGDAVIGTFFKKNEYNPSFKLGQGAYSFELIDRLVDYTFEEYYENEEIFCLYTRAFDCADQGLLTFQENSESCSPFTDVDFLEFCYSIPLNLRFKHKIYFDWILQKYPEAAEYVWEKTGEKIQAFENIEPKYMRLFGKKVPSFDNPEFPRWLIGAVLRRLGLRKKNSKAKTIVLNSTRSMTPIDYWYKNNNSLRAFMDSYWDRYNHLIMDATLRDDLEHLYKDCVVYEKLQSLSVLSALKLIYS